MSISRRDFLSGLGGAGLASALNAAASAHSGTRTVPRNFIPSRFQRPDFVTAFTDFLKSHQNQQGRNKLQHPNSYFIARGGKHVDPRGLASSEVSAIAELDTAYNQIQSWDMNDSDPRDQKAILNARENLNVKARLYILSGRFNQDIQRISEPETRFSQHVRALATLYLCLHGGDSELDEAAQLYLIEEMSKLDLPPQLGRELENKMVIDISERLLTDLDLRHALYRLRTLDKKLKLTEDEAAIRFESRNIIVSRINMHVHMAFQENPASFILEKLPDEFNKDPSGIMIPLYGEDPDRQFNPLETLVHQAGGRLIFVNYDIEDTPGLVMTALEESLHAVHNVWVQDLIKDRFQIHDTKYSFAQALFLNGLMYATYDHDACAQNLKSQCESSQHLYVQQPAERWAKRPREKIAIMFFHHLKLQDYVQKTRDAFEILPSP
ncbi:MAG: hypothetical protein J0L77_01290 [Alphaproteobacteria bacterium]|nr:hypothetical protein [Alphaproteobacteria bacterium]